MKLIKQLLENFNQLTETNISVGKTVMISQPNSAEPVSVRIVGYNPGVNGGDEVEYMINGRRKLMNAHRFQKLMRRS